VNAKLGRGKNLHPRNDRRSIFLFPLYRSLLSDERFRTGRKTKRNEKEFSDGPAITPDQPQMR
jgi:hypothetical protein